MLTVLAVPRFTLRSGDPLVLAPLLVHVAAGMLAIVTGYVALYTVKGASAHRKSGILFVYAMVVMGLVGGTLAAIERNIGSAEGGLLAAYFVVTALTTVRPPTPTSRRLDLVGMTVAFAFASTNLTLGLDSVMRGARVRDGVPVPMYLFLGTVALLAGVSDVRVRRRGALRGAARLTRHLWRMCFALFIAAGSFFLGQAKVIPKPLRIWSVLFTLALLPLVAMLYWLWRVRVRRSLRNLVLVPAGGS